MHLNEKKLLFVKSINPFTVLVPNKVTKRRSIGNERSITVVTPQSLRKESSTSIVNVI